MFPEVLRLSRSSQKNTQTPKPRRSATFSESRIYGTPRQRKERSGRNEAHRHLLSAEAIVVASAVEEVVGVVGVVEADAEVVGEEGAVTGEGFSAPLTSGPGAEAHVSSYGMALCLRK